jgi:hypothetical protein
MLEKTGTVLEKYQEVEVGEPTHTDMHQHSFVGTIIDVLESRGTVIVEDQCGDAFEVDADNVEVLKDED